MYVPIDLSTFAAKFRTDFTEFANTTNFPDSVILFWAGLGIKLMNPKRWGEILYEGLELWVAHNVTLSAKDNASVNDGGLPGDSSGVISNQSAGGVNVSIDTSAALEAEGGNYNLTPYGTRLKRLIDIVGCGGAQLT